MNLSELISFQNVGLVGVFFYIASYAALQAGFLRGSGNAYTILNLIAASLVLISLTSDFNLSSVIIQVTWISISVFGLARRFFLHHSIRLDEHERTFAETKLPGLPKHDAKRFLDRGTWNDVPRDSLIVKEGEVFGKLAWVCNGQLAVYLEGREIGNIDQGEFFGELTALNGKPATATVYSCEDTRLFLIESEELKKLCNGDGHLAAIIQLSMGEGARSKIESANQRLVQEA